MEHPCIQCEMRRWYRSRLNIEINGENCPYECVKYKEWRKEHMDDTPEVRKEGRWLKRPSKYERACGGSRVSTCSVCGEWGRKSFEYCPHCGAKMEAGYEY